MRKIHINSYEYDYETCSHTVDSEYIPVLPINRCLLKSQWNWNIVYMFLRNIVYTVHFGLKLTQCGTGEYVKLWKVGLPFSRFTFSKLSTFKVVWCHFKRQSPALAQSHPPQGKSAYLCSLTTSADPLAPPPLQGHREEEIRYIESQNTSCYLHLCPSLWPSLALEQHL